MNQSDENARENFTKFIYGIMIGSFIVYLGRLKARIPHRCNPGGDFDSGALMCMNCIREYVQRSVTLRSRRFVAIVLMVCSMVCGARNLLFIYDTGDTDYFYLRLNCLFFLLAIYVSYDYNLILPYLDAYLWLCIGSVCAMPIAARYNINLDYISGSMIVSSLLLMLLGLWNRFMQVRSRRQ